MSHNQTETYADVYFLAKHGGGDRIIVADNQPATLSIDNVEDEDGNPTPVLVAAVEAGNLVVEMLLDAAHVEQMLPPTPLQLVESLAQLDALPLGAAVVWTNRVFTRAVPGVLGSPASPYGDDYEWVCGDGGYVTHEARTIMVGHAQVLYVPPAARPFPTTEEVAAARDLILKVALSVPAAHFDDPLGRLVEVASEVAHPTADGGSDVLYEQVSRAANTLHDMNLI
ncbi:hypothetical protein [Gordonia sputi]|uniref:hypothetical protein n=1 Tax=Gordonia sputi TaxID=36823 RepID=UPI0036843CB5